MLIPKHPSGQLSMDEVLDKPDLSGLFAGGHTTDIGHPNLFLNRIPQNYRSPIGSLFKDSALLAECPQELLDGVRTTIYDALRKPTHRMAHREALITALAAMDMEADGASDLAATFLSRQNETPYQRRARKAAAAGAYLRARQNDGGTHGD